MSILSVIRKALREMLWLRRFLPFFLLYLSFSIAAFVFLAPLINLASCSELTSIQALKSLATAALINISLLFVVLMIAVLANLWFTGALVDDIKRKKGFEAGLSFSKKLYWQILLLSFVIFLLYGLSTLFGGFSLVVQVLVGWVFMFGMPALVIKKESFEKALKRSYSIVRKNVISTFVFWVLTKFIIFAIAFIALISVAIVISPILMSIRSSTLSSTSPIQSSVAGQAFVSIGKKAVQNYPLVLIALAVASFFLAISYCFNFISKTYYFLELSKRRR